MLKIRNGLILVLSGVLIVWTGHALAQSSEEEELRQVRGEMEDAKSRSNEYDREVRELSEETRKLRRRLVAVTARVLEKEAAVNEAEANLEALEEKEIASEALFEKKSEALVETIAALQILQQNPPPALLVKPDDALDAARSSILLSEIAPLLKEQADELAFKLTELRLIRDAVEDQRLSLLEADKELAQERKGLQKMLAQREKKFDAISQKANAERSRVKKLAKTANNLEELLASLKAIPPIFPRAKPNLEPRLADGSLSRSQRNSGLTSSEGLQATLFSETKGSLRPPALGRISSQFDKIDGSGGKTKGISIATQPNAQVIAPFDGEIVFAGSYLGYGELLIIEAGEGYHLVLSGMVRIDGVVGQRLLAGEPIGVMGRGLGTASSGQSGSLGEPKSGNSASSSARAREAAKPHLYFEMRRHGKPIDPEPWLNGSERKVRG